MPDFQHGRIGTLTIGTFDFLLLEWLVIQSFVFIINCWQYLTIGKLIPLYLHLSGQQPVSVNTCVQAGSSNRSCSRWYTSTQRILSKQFIFYFFNCFLSNRILVAISESSNFYCQSVATEAVSNHRSKPWGWISAHYCKWASQRMHFYTQVD